MTVIYNSIIKEYGGHLDGYLGYVIWIWFYSGSNGFIGFLASTNIYLDTKIITLSLIITEIYTIEENGGHLGGHIVYI